MVARFYNNYRKAQTQAATFFSHKKTRPAALFLF